MSSMFNDIKGNPLRIAKFLFNNKKGSSSATRGNIVNLFYVSYRLIENEAKIDDDINFLIDKKLLEREERNLWLTDLGLSEFTK